jgi:hypothetical protein
VVQLFIGQWMYMHITVIQIKHTKNPNSCFGKADIFPNRRVSRFRLRRFRARPDHEFAAGFVPGEKAFENRSANLRRGPDLRRSRSLLGRRRRLDKAVEKPAPKSSGSNLLDGGIRFPMERKRHGREIGFVRDTEMLETLAHTPGTGRRLPIELLLAEFSEELPGGLVVDVQVRGKANGPVRCTPLILYGP